MWCPYAAIAIILVLFLAQQFRYALPILALPIYFTSELRTWRTAHQSSAIAFVMVEIALGAASDPGFWFSRRMKV